MTISVGATISSTHDSSTSNLLLGHTVDVGTDALIVVIGIRSSSPSAAVITSVTWNSTESLSSCRARYIGSVYYQHFWILENPTAGSHSVDIWTTSTVDEISATAINLDSTINNVQYADGNEAYYSGYDPEIYVYAIGGAPEFGIGSIVAYGSQSNLSVSPGYGDEASEEDLAPRTHGVAYDDGGSGCDIIWTLINPGDCYMQACLFSENPDSSPSASPSGSPSTSPSASPSESPSVSPSGSPSVSPSASPSPSSSPSGSPSSSPSPPVDDKLELIRTEELAFNRTAVIEHGWNAIDFLRDRFLAPGDSDNYDIDLTFTYNAGNINSITVRGGDGDGEEGLELKVNIFGLAI